MNNITKTIMTYTTIAIMALGALGCQKSQANNPIKDEEGYSDYDAVLMPIYFMEEIYKIQVDMAEFYHQMKDE